MMIVHKKLYGWLSFALTFWVLGQLASPLAHAQTDEEAVGVLIMEDEAGASRSYSTYYHTGFGWKTLLDATVANPLPDGSNGGGSASVEFWIKSTGTGKGYTLADQNGFYLTVNNTGSLTANIGTQTHTASLPYDGESVDTWHHMALVLTHNGANLAIYHNGEPLASYTGLDYTPGVGNLYFNKGINSNIQLTEVRAWTTAREVSDLSFEMYEVFAYNTTNELENRLTARGLVGYYGDDNATANNASSFMSDLRTVAWVNRQASLWATHTNPGVGNGRATYSVSGTVLVQVRDDVQHPSAFNTGIILKATKGAHGVAGIQIKWLPYRGADQYAIRRDNVLIETLDDMGTQRTGITFTDENIVPGQLYTYRVSGYSSTDANLAVSSNEAQGFILYNGMISGTILSESKVAVDSVAVTGRPSTADLPGHALTGGVPLKMSSTTALTNATGITLGFWYKANAASGTQDSVLVAGNTKVLFNGSSLEVRSITATGSSLLTSAPVNTVTNWHQYTIVLGGNNGTPSLFQDGQAINSSALAFAGLNGGSKVVFNGAQGTSFTMDELVIWARAKTAGQIAADYNHMRNLSSEEEADGLAYYFRFDLGNAQEAYNLLNNSPYAEVVASPIESSQTLTFTTASQQPDNLVIGGFTNKGGNYTIASINYGQSGHMSFTLTPAKPNHSFRPASAQEILRVSEDYRQYQKLDVDFTDVSQLPVSGTIYYTVDVNGTDEQYPVPEGQRMTRNGEIANGEKANTDRFGQYLISAEVGNTTIAPHNPTRERAFGLQSVYFDGTAYMQSEQTMSLTDSATWTFYVNLGATATTTTQTLWVLGDLRLDLESGQTPVLYDGTTEVVRSTHILQLDTWNFVGLSLSNTEATITVGGQGTSVPGLSNLLNGANGTLYLGAKVAAGTATSQYFNGHLDHVAYRKAEYTASTLANLDAGEYLAGDADNVSGNADKLLALWAFNEQPQGNIPLRALSAQSGARNYALAHVGTQYSTTESTDHAQGYRYTFRATNGNYNPMGGEYPNLNVVTPKDNMDFENLTRFGISGQIATPCGYSVGEWAGKVVRTDLNGYTYERAIDAAEWNNEYTLFTIGDLMPGSYRIELEHIGLDPNGDGVGNGSGKILRSPIIEVRDGWQTYSFAYREDLTVAATITAVATGSLDDRNNFVYTAYSSACADKTIVNAGVTYKVAVAVIEDYSIYNATGSSTTCPVPGATVIPSGDLGPAFSINNSSTLTTNATGNIEFIVLANSPNFSAEEDFLRHLYVAAFDDYHEAVQDDIAAVVLGRVQYDNDFTLNAPETLVGILHDPPGDNSYATLSKGTRFMYEKNFVNGTSGSFDFNIGAGFDWEASAGVAVEQKVSQLQLFLGAQVSTYSVTADASTAFEQLELTQDISTSASPVDAGYRSDVYIGYSSVIRMGTGDELKLDGCNVVHETSVAVNTVADVIPFFHSHHEVEYTLLPNLDTLVAKGKRDSVAYIGTADADSVNNMLSSLISQRNQWKALLDSNVAHVNRTPEYATYTLHNNNIDNEGNTISLPQRLAFSGGSGEISYALGYDNEAGKGKYDFFEGGGGVYSHGYIMGGGIAGEFAVSAIAMGYDDEYSEQGSGNSSMLTVVFDDDDEGDQFEVATAADRINGGLPMFKTISGRSMCPYEENTVNRESIELKVVGGGYQQVAHGETAVFQLTVTNNQPIEDATDKTFYIWLDHFSNHGGANVSMNGDFMITPVPYHLSYGESTTAWISIEEGVTDSVNFSDIRIYVSSACEYDQGTLPYTEEIMFTDDKVAAGQTGDNGLRIRDWVDLSVDFTQPCAQAITLSTPTNQWVVNSTTNNALPFRFTIDPGLEGLNGLRVEYTTGSNNEVLMLTELDLTTVTWTDGTTTGDATQMADLAALGLVKRTDGSYTYTADVSGLSNGAYNFRLTPVCPTSQLNASAWASGNIYREIPVITSVTPYQNSFWEQGNLVVGYNREISSMNLNPSNITLRGVLAGVNYTMYAASLQAPAHEITVPHHNGLDLDSAYTVEAWLKPTAYPAETVTIIGKGSQLAITMNAQGQIGTNRTQFTSSALPLNSYTHVAVVYDGTNTISTYFNGVQALAESNVAVYTTNTDDLAIAHPTAGGASYLGAIDELRIWEGTRSNLAIQSDMGGMLMGNEPSLRAYFPLDNNALEGEAIRDFTGAASGTTATGLAFDEVTATDQTVSADEAVVTIPLNIHHQGHEFVVMPIYSPYYLEGSLLTATVRDNKVLDLFGNPAKGKTWSFRYNHNAIAWNQGAVIDYTPVGQSLSFSLQLNNQGASTASYTLNTLPSWLTLSSSTAPSDSYQDPMQSTYIGWNATHNFTFTVDNTLAEGKYTGYITADTDNGLESVWVEIYVGAANQALANYARTQAGMAVTPEPEPLGQVSLSSLPNPFSQQTRLEYTLPEAALVSLKVVDLLGRPVATLVESGVQQAGPHSATWHLADTHGGSLPTGMYLAILSVNGERTICRLMIND